MARPVPIERRPYKIRAWVSVDPGTRLDDRGRLALIESWRTLVRRFVGTPWNLDVDEGNGPLVEGGLEELGQEVIAPLAKEYDKVWLIRIGPAASGYDLSGREYDAATTVLGPLKRRPAPYPDDLARALLNLALDVFAPTAEIGEASGGGVSVKVQGGALPVADPIGRLVRVGTVFRPVRIYARPDGSTLRLDLIRSTYLPVLSIEGASARCSIVSAYRDPLTTRSMQTTRLLAVGIEPANVPTRLRFMVAGAERTPAAGYTLTARRVPDAPPREVGTTDRDGRITLPAGFADGLVVVRLLAANIEPLIEFPLMPGELIDEKTYVIEGTKSKAVAFETRLYALRDDVLDQIARRRRIEARMKARAEGDAWDEVALLLDQFRTLPSREAMQKALQTVEDEARHQQDPKTPILTKAAQALLADTRSMIEGYLDDDLFKAYDDALQQARARPAAAAAKPAAASKPVHPGAAAPAPAARPPAPAPAAKPAAPKPKTVVPVNPF
ncbi:MAG: hypothetical protein ABI353_11060 [Isosphaeraceae bacterium]